MPRWLNRMLFVALVFALCWGGAIWYWRAERHAPDSTDMLLLLLALPLAVLLVVWLGRVLIGFVAGAPALAAPTAAEPDAPAAPAPSAPPPPLYIAAGALRTAHGVSASALAAAIAGKKARPGLDPELLDDEGYPLMSARAACADSADTSEVRTDIGIWFSLNGWPLLRFSDEQWRALTLATAVADELGAAAATHRSLAPSQAEPDLTRLPSLLLLAVWPASLSAEQRQACASWLRHVVTQHGWPAARVKLAEQRDDEGRHAPPSSIIERLGEMALRAESPLLAMVLACGSQIGSASVARMGDAGTLFTARHPQGMIPGEGAAGVLLADAAQAALLGQGAHPMLHSADQLREESADDARRPDGAVLRALAQRVLGFGQAEAASVAMLVADTGHRSTRVRELMALAGAALPQLDVADDVVQLGVACGSCGAVPYLGALVLASHQAGELAAPVLCLSNEDTHRRSAALIRPAAVLS